MRKITQRAAHYFFCDRNFLNGNTQVRIINGRTELLLFGNVIAKKEGDDLWINLCGWNTPTTRDRLNGLPHVRVTTSKGQAYLNGSPISDNSWVKV